MGLRVFAVALIDARYAGWLEEQGFARETRHSRVGQVERADRWIYTRYGRHLARAQEDHIRAFLNRGVSASTKNNDLCSIRSFFEYCIEDDIRANDPTIRIKRAPMPHYLPRPLGVEEVRRLRLAAQTLSLRHRVVVDMLLFAGPRRAEVAGLEWRNVDLETKRIRFFGKGSREGIVPLHDYLVDLLTVWRAVEPGRWLFPSTNHGVPRGDTHLRPTSIWRLVKEVGQRAGVKAAPHRLRHTFASQLFEEGADIKVVADLLRHANLSSVQVYTKVAISRLEPDLRRLAY